MAFKITSVYSTDEIDPEFSRKSEPDVPVSPKSSAQNPVSPSSDEGVGSFGGSGNGASSPCRTGGRQSSDYSPSANSITSSENETSPKIEEAGKDM